MSENLTESFEDSQDFNNPNVQATLFEPKFCTRVCNPIKDGDKLIFTLKSIEYSSGIEHNVQRSYEDFELIHQCLLANPLSDGIIIPPLPSKPQIQIKDAEIKAKSRLSNSRIIMGDEFQPTSRGIELFLRHVLEHSCFGDDTAVHSFLTNEGPLQSTKVRKGFFDKLADSLDKEIRVSHNDTDAFFQKIREWVIAYKDQLKNTTMNFERLIQAEQKLSIVFMDVSALMKTLFTEDNNSKLSTTIGQIFDDCKYGLHIEISNNTNTLLFHFKYYTRYLNSFMEMLLRRIMILMEYEEACKGVNKARQSKYNTAMELKTKAQKALDDCSATARQEIVLFHRYRRHFFQEALSSYVEAKIKTARDTYTLLAQNRLNIEKISVP